MIRIDVAEWREAPLRAHLRSMRLGGVSFLEAHCSPVVLTRSRELIGDGNDDLGLFISLASSFYCDFVDRTLGQGEVALTDNSRAASIVCSGGGSFFALSMPRKALMSLAPDAEDRLKRPAVDGDRPELRLLRNYLETLLTSSAVKAATLRAAGRACAGPRRAGSGGRRRRGSRRVGGRPAGGARARGAPERIGATAQPEAIAGGHRQNERRLRTIFATIVRRDGHEFLGVPQRATARTGASIAGQPASPQPAHRRDRLRGGLLRSFAFQPSLPRAFPHDALGGARAKRAVRR